MLYLNPTLALTATLWHTLALSGSLLLSNFEIQPLIGSQGPCSALIADATMTHFIPLCIHIFVFCLQVELMSAEKFDPQTGKWEMVKEMHRKRQH